MIPLKQSTASQSKVIGPFIDDTDGATAETGLSIANTDIRLSKNGGNIAAKNSGGGTHDELGYYTITLDATDTDTVGRLQLMVKMAGALPVYHEYQVLEEAVYDALFAASAPGYVANAPVNVAQISGDGTAADNAESFFDGTGYAGTNNVIPTVTTLTGHTVQTGDSFARLGAPAGASVSADIATVDDNVDTLLTRITSTLFSGITSLAQWLGLIAGKQTGNSTARTEVRATGAGSGTFDETTDSIEAIRDRGDAEWTTGAGGSAPTVGEIADAVWDEATAGHTTAGTFGEQLKTDVDAILADTNELQGDWEDGGRLDLILDARASQSSVNGLNNFDPATDTVANVTTVATATNLTNLPTIPTDWIAAAGVSAAAVTKIQDGLSTLAIGDISGLEITELSSVPGASPTLEEALALLYMALRNKIDVTSSAKEIHNDAGTALGSKSLSDDGSTYSEAKLA